MYLIFGKCQCKYLLLWALVSSVVSCSTQVQRLAACCSAAFSCGGSCGFCCLCDLDALRRDSFFLIFELKGFLPPVSWCPVLLVVTVATRQRTYEKQHSGDFAVDCFVAFKYFYVCLCLVLLDNPRHNGLKILNIWQGGQEASDVQQVVALFKAAIKKEAI